MKLKIREVKENWIKDIAIWVGVALGTYALLWLVSKVPLLLVALLMAWKLK